MKSILSIAVAFLIALAFWCGVKHERKNASNCSHLQQQVTILKTINSSTEWYLADEQRKNAAFLEVIEGMGK